MNDEEIKQLKAFVFESLNKEEKLLTDTELKNKVEAFFYWYIGRPDKQYSSDNNDIIFKKVFDEIKANYSVRLGEGIVINEEYKKWFLERKPSLDMRYWSRYKQHLKNKEMPFNVVNKIDDVLDTITDLLGDPEVDGDFQRRGLVIGDVQSGKTANYIGLMCKAADANYKVIILLTGTIEKLRKQTQGRVEEGFIGLNTNPKIKEKKIGVGLIDDKIAPFAFTSYEYDFRKALAKNSAMDIDTSENKIVFVLKKNATTLRQLKEWLDNGSDKMNSPMLMIDDECDNASANTNDPEKDPTTINRLIREILAMFKKASYIGYTATPYANIFIDPDLDNEVEKQDLFPRDYIYVLDTPTDYYGADRIFAEEGECNYMLQDITEEELSMSIPLNKKDDFTCKIPNSMKRAIRHFMLGNVIRDFNGDTNKHRSMMINVSPSIQKQFEIEEVVVEYVKNVQESIRNFSKLDDEEAELNNDIVDLKHTFEDYFSEFDFTWNEVKNHLLKSVEPIKVVTVNSKSKKESKNVLEYDESIQRVIVVGGFSLSRGLTLEGLMTSYVFGRTKMYDTLMQKGRWFGYRNGYEKLCTIWMTKESQEWYRSISEATDELKNSIRKMREENARPIEFGLRVRCDLDSLEITARNKMRTAKEIMRNVILSEEFVETPVLKTSLESRIKNNAAILNLIQTSNCVIDRDTETKEFGLKKVPKQKIIEFLNNYDVSILNTKFNSEGIVDFINRYEGNELDEWDVGFISGSSKRYVPYSEQVSPIRRSFTLSNEGKILNLSGSKKRLGSSDDSRFGLGEKQKEEIESKIIGVEMSRGKLKKKCSEKDYMRFVKRNPLLLIYAIELNNSLEKGSEKEFEEREKFLKENENALFTGIGLGIPKLTNSKTTYATYKINLVAQREYEEYNGYDDLVEDGDED